jgi:hypothetical protein
VHEGQRHVPGKSYIQGRSRWILASEHFGPEQDQRSSRCGCNSNHGQKNYSDPNEAIRSLFQRHQSSGFDALLYEDGGRDDVFYEGGNFSKLAGEVGAKYKSPV